RLHVCFLLSSLCVIHLSVHRRALHSFPTRRSSDLPPDTAPAALRPAPARHSPASPSKEKGFWLSRKITFSVRRFRMDSIAPTTLDRKSTRLNSSHVSTSYAVFCLKKNKSTNRDRGQ